MLEILYWIGWFIAAESFVEFKEWETFQKMDLYYGFVPLMIFLIGHRVWQCFVIKAWWEQLKPSTTKIEPNEATAPQEPIVIQNQGDVQMQETPAATQIYVDPNR